MKEVNKRTAREKQLCNLTFPETLRITYSLDVVTGHGVTSKKYDIDNPFERFKRINVGVGGWLTRKDPSENPKNMPTAS